MLVAVMLFLSLGLDTLAVAVGLGLSGLPRSKCLSFSLLTSDNSPFLLIGMGMRVVRFSTDNAFKLADIKKSSIIGSADRAALGVE